jgi:hypothetical protein
LNEKVQGVQSSEEKHIAQASQDFDTGMGYEEESWWCLLSSSDSLWI